MRYKTSQQRHSSNLGKDPKTMINVEEFKHTPERRAELVKNLTPKQAKMANHWMDLFDLGFNVGDFVKMDEFFHPDMKYGNPTRLDIPPSASWKPSPMALYKICQSEQRRGEKDCPSTWR